MPIVRFHAHGGDHAIAYAADDFDYVVDPRALIQAFYGDSDLDDEELADMHASIVVEED